jgi:DNA polymerase-1
MNNKRIFLIDATAFCYRAFYAVSGLSTSFGQPTNAIYGFLNMLQKILKEKRPQFLGACFDISRDTFRLKKFAEYKKQRPAMPDDLAGQIHLIKEIVLAYGIPIFEKEGFEADDVIASLAKKARQQGFSVTIISSDKDILQLVDEEVRVFSPYKDAGTTYDRKKVIERFGVEPDKIPDIIALMGDAADNIPSVPGIGEKTAQELIKAFGSLEKLLDNVAGIKQQKLRAAISDNIENIKLSKELALLDSDMDLIPDLESLKIKGPDYKEISRLFKYLEFKKFLKDLPALDIDTPRAEAGIIEDAQLEGAFSAGDEMFFYSSGEGDVIFALQGRILRLESQASNARKILSDSRIKKISHDFKKIKVSFQQSDLVVEGAYFDTMVAAYLLDPAKREYSLADISADYLEEPFGNAAIGSSEAVDLILKLRPKLEKELRQKQLWELFNSLEMPLVEVLADMELTGIKLDLKVLEELSGDLEKRLIKLVEEIYEQSGAQFNINSPKQLREILFNKLKLPVIKKSKTGPSTDEEVLRKLADKHKLPALLLEYRQLAKLKSTYVDALPELVSPKTGRLHSSFNQTGTETGRLSSSNPNLQNIPIKTEIGRSIRRAIIASAPGNYLLACDYSQIELRILAHLSKDESLIGAFREDKDIHRITASLIYGVAEEEVQEAMRNVAKRVNFGIVYGLSSYGLARDLNIPQAQAQTFIDQYFLRYPKVEGYIQQQIEKARKQGFVTTLLGRRRYIPEANNKNQGLRQFAERQAVNAPIQGSASDLIKLAMVEIHKEIKQKPWKSRMILQVHDELLFDVLPKELDEFVVLVKDRMENVLKLDVPVRVKIEKGKDWLNMEPA